MRYRSQLCLQPVTENDEEFKCSEVFSYDELGEKADGCVEKTCHHANNLALVFKINMVPILDTVMSHSAQEEFDKPYILHLWPTVLLRNLLPYPIVYTLVV